MTPLERLDPQDLLIRIDERVKAIQQDIREINEVRRCSSNLVKIQTLEKVVWGCLAGVTATGARLLYEAFK